MPAITSATITAFYLFDVAEQIDLGQLRSAIGRRAVDARLPTKVTAPSSLQYTTPPVVVDGESLDVRDVDGFSLRVKFFDYGILSLALSRPFAGEWPALIELGQIYLESEHLEQRAETITRQLVERLATSLTDVRTTFLTEDYLVYSVTGLETPTTADELIAARADDIALLVNGEQQALSPQQREETLRGRLSYLVDDLVVPTWNAAFVYDTDAGVQAALEIIEFANSQLLEFRAYDERLELELGRIYAQLHERRGFAWFGGRRYVAATRRLHTLFIDVNEITDRTENTLKMVGDIYAARLFTLVGSRLGLARWKASVEEKLKTLDDIYHFAVEQVGISRGHFLELTIVLILVLELVLFFLGIMR